MVHVSHQYSRCHSCHLASTPKQSISSPSINPYLSKASDQRPVFFRRPTALPTPRQCSCDSRKNSPGHKGAQEQIYRLLPVRATNGQPLHYSDRTPRQEALGRMHPLRTVSDGGLPFAYFFDEVCLGSFKVPLSAGKRKIRPNPASASSSSSSWCTQLGSSRIICERSGS